MYIQVIHAEVKVATMLVKHNIPLSLADELTPLFHEIFPDSEIAKKFSSRHTKTACIINGALAPFYHRKLVLVMQNEAFAICIDASSDTGCEKMHPLTVRSFGEDKVTTPFLDICTSSSSTAEDIFATIEDAFAKCGISFQNCVGIGLDNTSVNMGCRNSIRSRIMQKNSAVYVTGCPCHIVHNIAVKASVAFESVSIHLYVLPFFTSL